MSVSPAPPKDRRPLIVIVVVAFVGLCLFVAAAVTAFYLLRNRVGRGAQPTIEYILDASPRMNSASGGDSRISVARGVLAEIVRTSDPQLTAGLRVFGTGVSGESCQDTNLLVPLATSNQVKIEKGLGGVAPGSKPDSPLAGAMIAAIRDVAKTKGPQSIVVVTGGSDSCNPESGELIRQEAQRAGVDLKLFVIGFDVTPADAEAIRAMVAMIPGATYKEAPEPTALRSALTQIQVEVNQWTAGTSKPSPKSAVGATACDHPYFPLRTGASWTFGGTDGTMTWSVSGATGSTDSASATMDIATSSGNLTVHWTCGSEGIVSYDFGSISAPGFGQFATMNVVDSSGTLLPPADRLTPGSSWPTNFTLVMNVSAQGVTLDMNAKTSETWTAAGTETVSVPAGTFQALRVDGTSTTSISGTMVPVTVSTTSMTYWYAKGVGIVRYTYASDQVSGGADLTAYSVP